MKEATAPESDRCPDCDELPGQHKANCFPAFGPEFAERQPVPMAGGEPPERLRS